MNGRTAPGAVRIIAGSLRGSKLPVADRPGLRPTSDRVRETLFNWLQAEVAGARVLDLFAGSGALGFEAASRGAASLTLVERDPTLADSLRETVARLKLASARVEACDALAFLARPPGPGFDLVFLDPPFSSDLWQPAALALAPWLAPQAWVYLEAPRRSPFAPPEGWTQHRRGETRDVAYTLYRVQGGQPPDSTGTLAT